MTHDGIQFTANQNIVEVPTPDGGNPSYVYFGRVCKPESNGAVKTSVKRGGVFLYAKPIPCEGHSKTNMMYGPNQKVYLKYDGRCYVG